MERILKNEPLKFHKLQDLIDAQKKNLTPKSQRGFAKRSDPSNSICWNEQTNLIQQFIKYLNPGHVNISVADHTHSNRIRHHRTQRALNKNAYSLRFCAQNILENKIGTKKISNCRSCQANALDRIGQTYTEPPSGRIWWCYYPWRPSFALQVPI